MPRTLFHRTESARVTEFEDNAVLLDMSSDTYYALNTTGLLVWNQLLDGGTVDEVIDTVAAMYRLERAVVATDVNRLVKELVEAGLIAPHTQI